MDATVPSGPPAPAPGARDRFRGCLLGGAVGDALGAPVEFLSHDRIADRYGEHGPADLGEAYGTVGAITDDTQMTLWTAEGLLNCAAAAAPLAAQTVYWSYLRWLATQGEPLPTYEDYPALRVEGGWLWSVDGLHARRAPGWTCLSALASGEIGTPLRPLNDSKGCGGVMRAAPAGLVAWRRPYDLGCAVAAVTHGHPTGQAAAGALAAAVFLLRDGADVDQALDDAERLARAEDGGDETADALAEARRLAQSAAPDAEAIQDLAVVTPERGPGWVAEEALAVAALCARRHGADGERALRAAVTHSGDSDSTGAICGNLVGAAHGTGAFPTQWTEAVELADVIRQVADDLHDCWVSGAEAGPPDGSWTERYDRSWASV